MLPVGGVARSATDSSGPEHCASRGDGGRSGEQAEDLGQWALLERRSARDLSLRNEQTSPQCRAG